MFDCPIWWHDFARSCGPSVWPCAEPCQIIHPWFRVPEPDAALLQTVALLVLVLLYRKHRARL